MLPGTNVLTFADKGYQATCGAIWTPFKRRRTRPSRRQKPSPPTAENARYPR